MHVCTLTGATNQHARVVKITYEPSNEGKTDGQYVGHLYIPLFDVCMTSLLSHFLFTICETISHAMSKFYGTTHILRERKKLWQNHTLKKEVAHNYTLFAEAMAKLHF